MNRPLLEAENLTKLFDVKREGILEKRRHVRAVDGVSFTIRDGETLGLVGESGCGKSTTGKMIVKLLSATSGRVLYRGEDIAEMTKSRDREYKRGVQIIFQDPYSSLDPRQTAGRIIAEPLVVNGFRREAKSEVLRLMAEVGLLEEQYDRYPHEFSGGQRQRIGVARALALNPSLIVCDEPVSALDVSIQAQIINLMQDLQRKHSLTYLFISHDLSVVKHISDRIAVMYLGRIVELAPKKRLFANPLHPYTIGLLEAVPVPDPHDIREQGVIKGDIPSPIDPPSGCRFHPRCPRAMDICRTEAPVMRDMGDGHTVECHLHSG